MLGCRRRSPEGTIQVTQRGLLHRRRLGADAPDRVHGPGCGRASGSLVAPGDRHRGQDGPRGPDRARDNSRSSPAQCEHKPCVVACSTSPTPARCRGRRCRIRDAPAMRGAHSRRRRTAYRDTGRDGLSPLHAHLVSTSTDVGSSSSTRWPSPDHLARSATAGSQTGRVQRRTRPRAPLLKDAATRPSDRHSSPTAGRSPTVRPTHRTLQPSQNHGHNGPSEVTVSRAVRPCRSSSNTSGTTPVARPSGSGYAARSPGLSSNKKRSQRLKPGSHLGQLHRLLINGSPVPGPAAPSIAAVHVPDHVVVNVHIGTTNAVLPLHVVRI